MSMLYSSDPAKTATIEDFVACKENDEMTYANFSIIAKCLESTNVQYAYNNVIYDYLDELKALAVDVVLSDKDYSKYKYKPKLLAYDIYGTTELFFVIMAVNGICNVRDFNKKKIKMLFKKDLEDFLNDVYSAESNYIQMNRDEIKETEE